MKDRRHVPAPLAPTETSRPPREDAPPIVDRSQVTRIVRRRLDPPDLRQTSLKKANAPTNEETQNRTAIVGTNVLRVAMNAPRVAMNGLRVVTIAQLIVTHVQTTIVQDAPCVGTNNLHVAMNDLRVAMNDPRLAANALRVAMNVPRVQTIAPLVAMNDPRVRTNDPLLAANVTRVQMIARRVQMIAPLVQTIALRVATNDPLVRTNDLRVAMIDPLLAANAPLVQTIARRVATNDRATISRQLEDPAKSVRRRRFSRRASPATNSARCRCPRAQNVVDSSPSSAARMSVNRRCSIRRSNNPWRLSRQPHKRRVTLCSALCTTAQPRLRFSIPLEFIAHARSSGA